MNKPTKDNIKIARRCMNFSGIKCDNKTCTNEYCPLNEVYDSYNLKTTENNLMKKDKTPCNKCGEWTISKRLGRAHCICEDCGYDKTLSDVFFYEALQESKHAQNKKEHANE